MSRNRQDSREGSTSTSFLVTRKWVPVLRKVLVPAQEGDANKVRREFWFLGAWFHFHVCLKEENNLISWERERK